MYLFLKGKMSRVIQYDTNDYFVQNPAVGISMGHPSCELNVYNIRVYENVLTFRQMVDNYIADMDDTDVMFAKLAANDILNEDSSEAEISYEKAVEKIPCITFIGELPKFKGDKRRIRKLSMRTVCTLSSRSLSIRLRTTCRALLHSITPVKTGNGRPLSNSSCRRPEPLQRNMLSVASMASVISCRRRLSRLSALKLTSQSLQALTTLARQTSFMKC